jgi:tetraacyldisaccharide 4'-kinase
MRRPWLAPLVPLYALGAMLRVRGLKVRRLGWPVISVGNLSTGGAGKTPLTIALARLLAVRGVHVDVLSRGYGRAVSDAVRVRPEGTAEEFGDEPLLIARAAEVPVYVAPQRYDAGVLAEAYADHAALHGTGASYRARAHILDDGFQHQQLMRDVDILLVNREDWSDALLPAGNLREARSAGRRASVMAIPAEDAALEGELRGWGWSGPVWRLRRSVNVPQVAGSVLAFCGIARPEQFFAGLEREGMQVAARSVFRDHYRYREADVNALVARARTAGAGALVTTEKDAVRLGVLAERFPADLLLHTATLSCAIEDEEAAIAWLLARLSVARAV